MKTQVAIIGAGIAGLSCALHLDRKGIKVDIYEHRSLAELSSRKFIEHYQTGRSMSMDISARGAYALRTLGLYEEVVAEAVPMIHRIFHGRDGSLTHIPYGRNDDEFILAVSRHHLFQILFCACQKSANIRFHFGHILLSADFNGPLLTFRNSDLNEDLIVHPDVVIGADGVHSTARKNFEDYTGHRFESKVLKQFYKELFIPAQEGRSLEKKAMHLWSRDEFMLVAQPNRDKSFTCALLLPEKDHEISFANLNNDEDVEKLFADYFPDVRSLLPNLLHDFKKAPTGRLHFLRGDSWTCSGNFLLIGDAAHGMVPFFGQGVNCSFEDCTVLSQCLEEAEEQWPIALTLFEQRRVKNGNAIGLMSYENYPELHQSKVFDRVLLKKQIEVELNRKYPSTYITYHNLVCFHRVPYLYALALKKLQEPLLDRLSHGIELLEQLNWQQVEKELEHYRRHLTSIKGFEDHAI